MLFLFFTRSLVDLKKNLAYVVDKFNQKWDSLAPKMEESDLFGISTFNNNVNKQFLIGVENWASSFDKNTHDGDYVEITKKVLPQLYNDYKFDADDGGTKSFDLKNHDSYLQALSIISSQLFQMNQRYVLGIYFTRFYEHFDKDFNFLQGFADFKNV